MNLQLPDAVQTYFDVSNGCDTSRLAVCFYPDARVTDENRTHQGIEAIEARQQDARQAFTYHVEPLEAVHEDGKLNVITRLTGSFPGSPVHLNHVFLLPQPKSPLLTTRECSILLEISRGASNKEVARRLEISPSTVRTHMESIFRKLGCSTRAAATLKGLTLGLIA